MLTIDQRKKLLDAGFRESIFIPTIWRNGNYSLGTGSGYFLLSISTKLSKYSKIAFTKNIDEAISAYYTDRNSRYLFWKLLTKIWKS